MDAKLKAKWVKALCSGKYPQGKGYLENNGKYCCLGVLRSVGNIKIGEDENGFLKFYNYQHDRFVALPEDAQRALATLNDQRVPFDMIAGLIEEAL
jgi:hypothetical protein